MKVDGGVGFDLSKVGDEAREAEEMGYSGIATAEMKTTFFKPAKPGEPIKAAGDVIKMGRIEYRVMEMQTGSNDNLQLKKISDDYSYMQSDMALCKPKLLTIS